MATTTLFDRSGKNLGSVELSDEPPSVAENAQPNHVRELKGPASGTENPKRAWFVLNSGRRVDAWVSSVVP